MANLNDLRNVKLEVEKLGLGKFTAVTIQQFQQQSKVAS